MNRAFIQLILSSPTLSLEEAEQFASYIRAAIQMAGAAAGMQVEVGNVTLETGENDGG